MQCAAIAARTGARCRHHARPGSAYCAYHKANARNENGGIPAASSVPESRLGATVDALDEVMDNSDIGREIALLRRQIREADRAGDAESVRRGVDTLCKALRVQHFLDGRSADSLSDSIAGVLEEIGNEIGVPL